MRRPWAWAVGAFAVAGFLRRRGEPVATAPDPRAEELRSKLAESREGAELTVDRAEPAPEDPESRRRAVHDSARETVEQMRRR